MRYIAQIRLFQKEWTPACRSSRISSTEIYRTSFPLIVSISRISSCAVLNSIMPAGEPDKACASDPIVQAATAKLNMVYTTSMGILSCLTTAGWGSVRPVCNQRAAGLILATVALGSPRSHSYPWNRGYWIALYRYQFHHCHEILAIPSRGLLVFLGRCPRGGQLGW